MTTLLATNKTALHLPRLAAAHTFLALTPQHQRPPPSFYRHLLAAAIPTSRQPTYRYAPSTGIRGALKRSGTFYHGHYRRELPAGAVNSTASA